jgi:hypothetical protein
MINFTRGAIVLLLGIVTWFFLMHAGTKWVERRPSPPEQKFEVVDTYRGCDVVRWHQHGLAEYKYFLHCGKVR